MGSLLFAENPLVVNTALAKIIGLNEAIVLQQIHYWLDINKRTNNNFRDGRYWTYNTIETWQAENFPFFSVRTVQRVLRSLEEKGLLLVGNYNQKGFDQTKWYTIDYETLESLDQVKTTEADSTICQIGMIEDANLASSNVPICRDATCQSGTFQHATLASPIPETTTETNTETTTEKKDSSSKQSFDSGSDEMKVVSYFVERLLGVKDYIKVPTTPTEKNNWCLQMDRLLRLDHRDKAEVCKIIRFATGDPFWKNIILSPKSLREKYDTLKMRMEDAESKQAQTTAQNPVVSTSWDDDASAATRAYIEKAKRGEFD